MEQSVCRYADALERIINVLALGQFVLSTGLICFAGFQITSVRSLDLLASRGVVDKEKNNHFQMIEDKGRLVKYSTFLNSAILELFIFSISGNGLMDEVIVKNYTRFNRNAAYIEVERI